MSNMKEIEHNSEVKERLTKRNRKFIELLLKDVNVVDAHRLSGYSGKRESAYQLKQKLKPFLAKAYEIEGLSREGYRTRLLKLLSLPCVDREGKPIASLSYGQYLEALKMLKDELPSNKVAVPSITAFIVQRYSDDRDTNQKDSVVQRYGQPQDEKKDKDFIDISPISGRSVKRT